MIKFYRNEDGPFFFESTDGVPYAHRRVVTREKVEDEETGEVTIEVSSDLVPLEGVPKYEEITEEQYRLELAEAQDAAIAADNEAEEAQDAAKVKADR